MKIETKKKDSLLNRLNNLFITIWRYISYRKYKHHKKVIYSDYYNTTPRLVKPLNESASQASKRRHENIRRVNRNYLRDKNKLKRLVKEDKKLLKEKIVEEFNKLI